MKICLGTAQLGQRYGIKGSNRLTFQEALTLLNISINVWDIDMLDTAPLYGDSEYIIGKYFENYPANKEKVKVVTKASSFTKGSSECYLDVALSSVENSLQTFAIDVIDGLFLHDEQDILNQKIIGSLSELKKRGLVRNIGVSVYDPRIAIKSTEIEEIDYIQIPYNILDRRLDDMNFFSIAKKHGKTIFARSVFLQGLLLMDEIPILRARKYINTFKEICSKYSMTVTQGCINYVLANNHIDYMIMGIETPNEMTENMRALIQPPNINFINEINSCIHCCDEYVLNPSLWNKKEVV